MFVFVLILPRSKRNNRSIIPDIANMYTCTLVIKDKYRVQNRFVSDFRGHTSAQSCPSWQLCTHRSRAHGWVVQEKGAGKWQHRADMGLWMGEFCGGSEVRRGQRQLGGQQGPPWVGLVEEGQRVWVQQLNLVLPARTPSADLGSKGHRAYHDGALYSWQH